MTTETDEPTDAETETKIEQPTELEAPFVVEASGPVYRYQTTGKSDMTEWTEATVEFQRKIETAAEFEFWAQLHTSGDQYKDAINHLFPGRGEYQVTDEQQSDWQICIDGPVAAYKSAAEHFMDSSNDLDWGSYTKTTRNCRMCALFGVGARIAEMDARREAGDSVDNYVEKYAEERL